MAAIRRLVAAHREEFGGVRLDSDRSIRTLVQEPVVLSEVAAARLILALQGELRVEGRVAGVAQDGRPLLVAADERLELGGRDSKPRSSAVALGGHP